MKLPYQSAFTRYLPLAILIVMALLLVHLLGCDGMQMAQAASSNAPVNVSGEFKGQMQHDPLFPAIDFNITVDITQQSGTSDIIPLQVTVLREATECWTSRPLAMTGNLVIHRDKKKTITLREVDLQTSDGTVTLKGDVKEDLKHAHFYYNSITPDTTPCKSIAAIGELAG